MNNQEDRETTTQTLCDMMRTALQIKEGVKRSGFTLISIALIVVTVIILYWQDLSILANEALQNEATSHIILVPILASYLVYRRREMVGASLAIERFRRKNTLFSLSEIAGIALCISAFLLYWYGSHTFHPIEFHVLSLTMFLVGITLTLFNVKTLVALIFPILFLIFLMPPPTKETLIAGAALGNFNAQTSYTLLRTLGMPVALSLEYGSPVILVNTSSERSAEFAVDQACSGIYSMVAFAMFAAFLVYVVRGSNRRKILLVPIGFMILPFLNILRISLIVAIAYNVGEEIAMTIFHTFSGWLMLSVGILLLLVVSEKTLHLRIVEPKSNSAHCNKCSDISSGNNPFCPNCGKFLTNRQTRPERRFWIKTTAILLASCVIALSLQAPVFVLAQGLTLTNADPTVNTAVFPTLSGYQLNFLYRDEAYERISRTDAAFIYAYFPKNISNPTVFLYLGVSRSIQRLHNWEDCLVTHETSQGLKPLVDVLEEKDTQLLQDPPIIAKYFVFHYPASFSAYGNYTQVTLYWFQEALFRTGLTVESRYVRTSIVILTRNPNDRFPLEQKLTDLGREIVTYWEPMKTRSVISLSIPTMQILLPSTIAFAIFIQATERSRQWRRKSNNLRIFERFGSPEEKLLYQEIKQLRQKTKETTTQNIESTFQEKVALSKRNCEVHGALENLKEQGIIEADIISVQDQPRLIWKP